MLSRRICRWGLFPSAHSNPPPRRQLNRPSKFEPLVNIVDENEHDISSDKSITEKKVSKSPSSGLYISSSYPSPKTSPSFHHRQQQQRPDSSIPSRPPSKKSVPEFVLDPADDNKARRRFPPIQKHSNIYNDNINNNINNNRRRSGTTGNSKDSSSSSPDDYSGHRPSFRKPERRQYDLEMNEYQERQTTKSRRSSATDGGGGGGGQQIDVNNNENQRQQISPLTEDSTTRSTSPEFVFRKEQTADSLLSLSSISTTRKNTQTSLRSQRESDLAFLDSFLPAGAGAAEDSSSIRPSKTAHDDNKPYSSKYEFGPEDDTAAAAELASVVLDLGLDSFHRDVSVAAAAEEKKRQKNLSKNGIPSTAAASATNRNQKGFSRYDDILSKTSRQTKLMKKTAGGFDYFDDGDRPQDQRQLCPRHDSASSSAAAAGNSSSVVQPSSAAPRADLMQLLSPNKHLSKSTTNSSADDPVLTEIEQRARLPRLDLLTWGNRLQYRPNEKLKQEIAQSFILRELIEFGVDLVYVDLKLRRLRQFSRLTWSTDVEPRIEWLRSMGVPKDEIPMIMSRSYRIFLNDIKRLVEKVTCIRDCTSLSHNELVSMLCYIDEWLPFGEKEEVHQLTSWFKETVGMTTPEIAGVFRNFHGLFHWEVDKKQKLYNALINQCGFNRSEIRRLFGRHPRVLSSIENVTVIELLMKEGGFTKDQIMANPPAIKSIRKAVNPTNLNLIDSYRQRIQIALLEDPNIFRDSNDRYVPPSAVAGTMNNFVRYLGISIDDYWARLAEAKRILDSMGADAKTTTSTTTSPPNQKKTAGLKAAAAGKSAGKSKTFDLRRNDSLLEE